LYIQSDILHHVDVALTLRAWRRRAGLTQADLAARTGTSQATVSAYERATKQPSVATLTKLLDAMGSRLTVESRRRPVRMPSAQDHARVARGLLDVLTLADSLPTRHESRLRFPRLNRSP
jgi:transcriptional regulator with XRE-family HTH domain